MSSKRVELIRSYATKIKYYRLLGIELEGMEEGRARLKVPFREELTHPLGAVQGGVLCTLADGAMALACLSLLGDDQAVATVELKLNFIAPFTEGTLVAEGRVVHLGSRTIVAEAELHVGERLMAKALATFIINALPEGLP
ncbi:MAG: PaaI family thioesterase [Nitrospinota bacterium]